MGYLSRPEKTLLYWQPQVIIDISRVTGYNLNYVWRKWRQSDPVKIFQRESGNVVYTSSIAGWWESKAYRR